MPLGRNAFCDSSARGVAFVGDKKSNRVGTPAPEIMDANWIWISGARPDLKVYATRWLSNTVLGMYAIAR